MAHATRLIAFVIMTAFAATACNGDDGGSSKSDASLPTGDGDGDGDGDRVCDLTGTYSVLLTQRDGDCGPVMEPAMLTVPDQAAGLTMHVEMQFGRNLITTFVHKGCSLRLTHEVVAKNGMLESTLNAGDLAQVSEGRLQGQATVQRFTATMPQTVACQGTYDMLMVKRP